MPNLINQVLLNQYRIDAFVASGGMGAVYRVWDLKRNVPLAMKVLHSELADDPHIFKRFKREANALKKLTHPHIVQFYGLYQTSDLAFLLERYVDGPSLKDILREQAGKPLSVQEALIYLKALSSALGYAHANGVVHCDVKPGNVLIDQGGNIYLTDFGIARHAESTTTTMGMAGTAAYMAPEQIRGESVTPATDVYALGVMLFEMLTGQRPFRGSEAGTETGGDTANERIRHAHLHLQPPNPQSLNPSISKELAQIILKALDKDPASRHQSMQAFLEGVYTASNTTQDRVADRIILPTQLQATTQSTQPPIRPVLPETLTTRRIIPWLIGAIALFVIMLIVGMIGRKTSNSNIRTIPLVTASPTYQFVPSPTSTQFVTRPTPTEESNNLPTGIGDQHFSDPAEFGRWYFTTIWQDRDYQYLWDTYLTPSFRSNSGSYQDYVAWWDSVDRIDVNSVETVRNDGKSAWIRVDVTLYKKDGRVLKNRKYDYDLLYDANKKTWMFDYHS